MARGEGSKVENTDFRFALVDSDGAERYPYRIKKRDGRFGFVIGRDREDQGEVVSSIEEVIRAVLFDGKRVRTTDFPPSEGKGSNGLSLFSGREVQGYRITSELAHLVLGAAEPPMGAPVGGGAGSASRATARVDVDWLGELELIPEPAFRDALAAVEPRMTGAQREMLRGHANSPMQELSMLDIASLGGYSDNAAANSQYGRLGRLFAEQLRVDADQLENKVQAMCVAAEQRDVSGHFVWCLRPQLLAALQAAGWVEPALSEAQSIETFGAEAEIAAEAACAGLPETTRKALVNARIGQGGYRQRMLLVWGGKCAVTGLALPEALIASHAMAWRDSDNHQRLDEYNGLLLSATLDRLFDVGLISFADTGCLLAKPSLAADVLMACGLSPEAQLRFVPERCKPYLNKHRQRFGFDA